MSHIPYFGDATTSPAGDAVSPAGDMDVSAGNAHLQWEITAYPEGDAASPAGDLLGSPHFGICDTTHRFSENSNRRVRLGGYIYPGM